LAGFATYKSISEDDPEVGNTKHFDDPVQAGLNFFKDDPLVAQPGTSFHYSNQGYTLIGCVIEGASGAKKSVFAGRKVVLKISEAKALGPLVFSVFDHGH
jgi:CubicO group peptidase (beta-lactamase class C family)